MKILTLMLLVLFSFNVNAFSKERYDLYENPYIYCDIPEYIKNIENKEKYKTCLSEYIEQSAINMFYNSMFIFCQEYYASKYNKGEDDNITINCNRFDSFFYSNVFKKNQNAKDINLDLKISNMLYIEGLFWYNFVTEENNKEVKNNANSESIVDFCSIDLENKKGIAAAKIYLYDKIECIIEFNEKVIFNISNLETNNVCNTTEFLSSNVMDDKTKFRLISVCENYDFEDYNVYKYYIDYLEALSYHFILNYGENI